MCKTKKNTGAKYRRQTKYRKIQEKYRKIDEIQENTGKIQAKYRKYKPVLWSVQVMKNTGKIQEKYRMTILTRHFPVNNTGNLYYSCIFLYFIQENDTPVFSEFLPVFPVFPGKFLYFPPVFSCIFSCGIIVE